MKPTQVGRKHQKPQTRRKDHYLPRGYLRGFIDPTRQALDRPLWCMRPHTGQWEQKSPAQVGYEVGLYDFASDALDEEHADTTFKFMEDNFPTIRTQLVDNDFENWTEHQDFFCRYMQMIRIRSPLYFEQKKQELSTQHIWTVAAVDGNKITLENMEGRLMTPAEIHDHTLSKMRAEFKLGVGWMKEFHWTLRTAADPFSPFITAEQPLFLVTPEILIVDAIQRHDTYIYFPLCWQACLVGNRVPWLSEAQPIAPDKMRVFRQMVSTQARKFVVSPQPIDLVQLRQID